MAPSSAATMVDPAKTAKYPVVLSDELLGKGARELYTAVRYNHKPALSSDFAPVNATLKASAGHQGAFNMAFSDNGDKYVYRGHRDTDKNQFALVFDHKRKVFVLHRIDSAFNMNLIRTPSDSDVDSLRALHPHMDRTGRPEKSLDKAAGKAGAASKSAAAKGAKDARVRKSGKDKAPPPAPLTLPKIKESVKAEIKATSGPSSKRRRTSPVNSDEDDDDDDDDGGLTIEYPEGEAPSSRPRTADFSPAFPAPIDRRFSTFVQDMDKNGDEDGDADSEFEDVPMEDEENQLSAFKLPSPVGQPGVAAAAVVVSDEDADAEADDIDADLEAELENAFQEVNRDIDSESSVSEED